MKRKNIIITGSSGLIGSTLISILSKSTYNIYPIYLTHRLKNNDSHQIQCDIRNTENVKTLISIDPTHIIHCAALTNIKTCQENQPLAYEINVKGTENIAYLAKQTSAKLIYLSTDAVFCGSKSKYNETSTCTPQTIYGKTKYEGEKTVQKICKDYLIIRTNTFGIPLAPWHTSFMATILRHLESNTSYTGFDDAYFCPLSTIYLSHIIQTLIEQNRTGIFHAVANESISKYEFSKLIATLFGYDPSLIKKGSIDTLCRNIPYPKNLILSASKEIRDHTIPIPKIEKMVIELRNNIPNKYLYKETKNVL